MTPHEARTAALRAFGPISQRGVPRHEDSHPDPELDPGFALYALLARAAAVPARGGDVSIAVAVGANTTIFNLASQLLLVMPSASRPDRLVTIRMGFGSHVSYRQWQHLEGSHALAGLAGYQIEAEVNWRGQDQAVSLTPLVVTANFFDVLGVPLALGADSPPARRRPRLPAVAVISYGFWAAAAGPRSRARQDRS